MTDTTPQRLTGPTNELAKERNRAAAERTLAAWMQNCLTLIGFGIAVDQINQALNRRTQSPALLITDHLAAAIAVGFICFGILLLGIALGQYRLEIKSIEQEEYVLLSISELNHWVVGAVVLFGVLSSLILVLSVQQY